MKRVFKVKPGDIVLLNVESGGPSSSVLEERLNKTAKETGVTFLVVQNINDIRVINVEERVVNKLADESEGEQ